MSSRLVMNKELGTKWFAFFTKVRPWFVVIFSLATFAQVPQYIGVYLSNLPLLISFVLSIVTAVLAILVAIKSDDDYENFVSFVKWVLIFEIINMGYNTAIQQYYENGYNWPTSITMGLIILVFAYFFWYRLNIKYFRKRLVIAPEVMIDSPRTTPVKVTVRHKISSTTTQTQEPTKHKPVTETVVIKTLDKNRKILFFVLIILFLLSFSYNIFLYFTNTKLKDEITILQAESEILVNNFSEEKESIQKQAQKIQELEERITELGKEKTKYKNSLDDVTKLLEFYQDNIALIRPDKDKIVYHRYDCERFVSDYYYWSNDGSFLVYRIEEAEALGYKPCSLCFD